MASVHRSFRLAVETADALDAAAAEHALDRTALAQRLISEGLTREEHPLLSFRDGSAGRVAFLAAAEVEVWQVIAAAAESEETLDALGLRDCELRAALRYHDAHRDEIEELIRRDQLARVREGVRLRRDDELLAEARARG
jgi:hypothetical protein